MTILRKFVAIVLGLLVASVVNALLLTAIAADEMPSGSELFFGTWLVALYGVLLTFPAWFVFCIVFLPVVSHRVRLGRVVTKSAYFASAFVFGALLIIPVMWAIGMETLWAVPLLGGIGGVSIAAMWWFFIIGNLATDRPANGAAIA